MPSAATQQQLEAAVEHLATVILDMEVDARPGYMMRAQRGAVARGKALFGSSALGRNGQTCESCHPDGRTTGGEAELPVQGRFPTKLRLPIPSLVGAAASFPRYKIPSDAVITLEMMNNNCIRMFLMGEGLALDSQEASDLVTYVSMFSQGRELSVGRMEVTQ